MRSKPNFFLYRGKTQTNPLRNPHKDFISKRKIRDFLLYKYSYLSIIIFLPTDPPGANKKSGGIPPLFTGMRSPDETIFSYTTEAFRRPSAWSARSDP